MAFEIVDKKQLEDAVVQLMAIDISLLPLGLQKILEDIKSAVLTTETYEVGFRIRIESTSQREAERIAGYARNGVLNAVSHPNTVRSVSGRIVSVDMGSVYESSSMG